MAAFLALSAQDRKDILEAASEHSGRSPEVLEKDIWVTWALDCLFSTPGLPRMAFKGGTSLSKAYGLIERFSEDIDVSLHYADGGGKVDPAKEAVTRSGQKTLDKHLRNWVNEQMHNVIVPSLVISGEKSGVQLMLATDDETHQIEIAYPSVVEERSDGFLDHVLLELGGRNEAEPSQSMRLSTYLEGFGNDIEYPKANVNVLAAERTFWEKVTGIHDQTLRNDAGRAARFSRHLNDVHRLWQSFDKETLLNDDGFMLLRRVCKHKEAFYFDKKWSDYAACTTGGLRLVPVQGEYAEALSADYDKSVASGMYLHKPEPFEQLLQTLGMIENAINKLATAPA